LEYRHLTAFLAVAEELHFGRAAKRLHIAQPPLSQQIRQLERELGVDLFERDKRSVRLTSAGFAMLQPARQAMESMNRAAQAAKAGGRGELGRVVIGFSGASSLAQLPRLAQRVREDHPGITLVLQGNLGANSALNDVAGGSIDLGFVRMPAERTGVATRVIGREELIAALPASHRLADSVEVSMSRLLSEPFVLPPVGMGSSLREAILSEFFALGSRPQIIQEANDSYTILALVAAGIGVTLTLSSVAEHVRNDSLRFCSLSGPKRYFYPALAWREANESPALGAVLAAAALEFGPDILDTDAGHASSST
jgi:DNA-binding transcriptional LysR family regulator